MPPFKFTAYVIGELTCTNVIKPSSHSNSDGLHAGMFFFRFSLNASLTGRSSGRRVKERYVRHPEMKENSRIMAPLNSKVEQDQRDEEFFNTNC